MTTEYRVVMPNDSYRTRCGYVEVTGANSRQSEDKALAKMRTRFAADPHALEMAWKDMIRGRLYVQKIEGNQIVASRLVSAADFGN